MQPEFPRPLVVVSKCLGFDHCRYNGEIIETPIVAKLQPLVDFRPVCPEVEIGLGIPRKPIRVVAVNGQRALYQPATGANVTDKMQAFVNLFLDDLTAVDGFLLKNRSPSCGQGDVKIYHGYEATSRTSKGSGFFGGAILERFPGLPIEDEGRLRNFALREHFFTRLYAFARLRAVKQAGQMPALINFHAIYKLLLMGYNQAQMRIMGKIVANQTQADFLTVFAQYAEHFKLALAKPPQAGPMINVLQHALGGFSKVLSREEKTFFLESLEEYRDERLPLSALLHVLRAWAVKYHNAYLLQQVVLQPYPVALMDLGDSGKGRAW
jgi:uncharacterized protein YbgA (DUF1722 family)/uncharacterized protein YbbK (DUF523 family)